MAVVNVTIRNPAFRQVVIYETVNLWDVATTRDHIEAMEDYLRTGNAGVLYRGDPPVIDTVNALVNGYWYVDGGPSTHPYHGHPLTPDGGTGWEYECFWVHEDDLGGHTITDLGEGAGSLTEACQWFLSAWKDVRG